MNYRDKQKKYVKKLSETNFFNDKMNGYLRGKPREFAVHSAVNNFFSGVYDDAVNYFKENNISWWGGYKPTTHTLSSQLACINHLFLFRNDEKAATRILQNVCPSIVRALKMNNDKTPSYISFEVVSENKSMLNEDGNTRGSNCTSLDAVMLGENKDGKILLFPIEWKYTECYGNTDKSAEPGKGEVRKKRYNPLLQTSNTPIQSAFIGWCYYEPFYQLMRQTLWAEQMIKNSSEQKIVADDYFHLHIVPKENTNLLDKNYKKCAGEDMKTSWKNVLRNPNKYCLLSPEEFVKPAFENNNQNKLLTYLQTRYWKSST